MRLTLLLLMLSPVTMAAPGAPNPNAEKPVRRPSDEERGKELWVRHCLACHGAENRGDGPAAASLVTPAPDLVGKVVEDEETNRLVLKGKGAMPGFESSFDRFDAKRVLQYMKSLPKKPTDGTKPAPAPVAPPVEPDPDAGDAAP